MTWTGLFTGVTSEVEAILVVVIPVAIGLFSIGLALRYAKRVLNLFN